MSSASSVLSVDQAIAAYNLTATSSDKITPNEVIVLKKMGFQNGEQLYYFNAERNANPNLKTFFKEYTDKFATDAKYDSVLKQMGQQIINDGKK